MSSEAKRIKILTLLEMLLGLVIAVIAGIYATGVSSTDPFVVVGEGIVTLVLGARGALIANVPARIGKLVPLFLIAFLVQVACVAIVVYLVDPSSVPSEPLTTICAAVPAVVSLIIVVLSRGMAKRAER